VPAYVQGTVPAGVAPGTLLALAVNGRVQTVATVAPEGGADTLRFAGMLPGSSFVAGANRPEVLAVEGSGPRRLPLRGPDRRHRAGQAVSSHMLVPLSRSHSGRAAPTRSRWQAASWELQKVIRSRGLPVSRARSR
jgi:hypothetical protein